MFGFRLVPKLQVKLMEERVQDLKNMLGRMEEEVSYWRDRANDERERADRINDVVMQQNGLPDVTPTVIKEKRAESVKVEGELEKHQGELAEMFADNFDGEDDLNWVDEDLQVAARGWMQKAKEVREAKLLTKEAN